MTSLKSPKKQNRGGRNHPRTNGSDSPMVSLKVVEPQDLKKKNKKKVKGLILWVVLPPMSTAAPTPLPCLASSPFHSKPPQPKQAKDSPITARTLLQQSKVQREGLHSQASYHRFKPTLNHQKKKKKKYL
jgi:hypothetical protein